jgi:hypothetical protein
MAYQTTSLYCIECSFGTEGITFSGNPALLASGAFDLSPGGPRLSCFGSPFEFYGV